VRLLLDESLPVALKGLLPNHDARTVRDMGWRGISNGKLLALAEENEFEALITCDKNLHYQQNMTGRRIAIVVLSSSQWQTVRAASPPILEALNSIFAGGYHTVDLGRPTLRRRPAGRGSHRGRGQSCS
jgi:predicted nuclease of predicted toxin-antitoxin system